MLKLTSGCHATTGKEEGSGIFVMMDATKMVDNYHMCWTGILAPALTIGLVVPSRKSSEVVHQHQETDHVRALFLQRRWEGSVRDRFRTLKAMRRSWKRRTWRRWSTFRRLGGAPFCLFPERGIFSRVVSYLSCGYNTSCARGSGSGWAVRAWDAPRSPCSQESPHKMSRKSKSGQ